MDSWGVEEEEEEEKEEKKKKEDIKEKKNDKKEVSENKEKKEQKKKETQVKKSATTSKRKTSKKSSPKTTKKSSPKTTKKTDTTRSKTTTKKKRTTSQKTKKSTEPKIDPKIFNKIDLLDSPKYKKIDTLLEKAFQKAKLGKYISIEAQKLFDDIQEKVFFRFTYNNKNMRFSYKNWKKEFPKYSGTSPGNHFILFKSEFTQFLTNKFKANWIKKNGENLSKQEFSLLKRAYRERKLIENVINHVEKQFFNLIEQKSFSEFLKGMRILIGGVVKQEMLTN